MLSLTSFHLLKQIKYLTRRTLDAYLRVEKIPIEAEIYKCIPNIFGVINELAFQKLTTKSKSSQGWFVYIYTLLKIYNLSGSHAFMVRPPSKPILMRMVPLAVSQHLKAHFKANSDKMSSLKHVNIVQCCVAKIYRY